MNVYIAIMQLSQPVREMNQQYISTLAGLGNGLFLSLGLGLLDAIQYKFLWCNMIKSMA